MNDNSCISPLRCMSDLPLAIFSGNMTVNWSSLHFPLSNIKGTYTKTFHFPYPKKWDLKKLSSTIFFAHLSFPAFLWLSGGLINRGSSHSLKLAVYLNRSLAKSSAWESLLSFNIVQPCVVIHFQGFCSCFFFVFVFVFVFVIARWYLWSVALPPNYEYVFSQNFPRQVPVYASSNPCSHGFMLGANMVTLVAAAMFGHTCPQCFVNPCACLPKYVHTWSLASIICSM